VAEPVIQDSARAHRDVGRDGHARRDMEIRRHVAQAFDTIAAIPSSLSYGTTTASGCAGVTTPLLVRTTSC
jgi:hypothetical protein